MRIAASASADLPALTSLRFFAAAMIFVFHQHSAGPADWIRAIQPGMYHGVSFFFVLSGFVLTYAYGGRDFSWRRFYLARVARLAPLHGFALLLLLAALPLAFARGQNLGPSDSLVALTLKAAMLDAWAPVHGFVYSWNSVSWSISVEMGFYAAFPLLLAAMSRRPLTTLAYAAALSLGVLVAGAAAGLPLFATYPYALTQVDLGSCFPPARGFEFALGMATCLVWRRWIEPARLPLAAWTAIEAAALAGTAAWLVLAAPALVNGAEGVAFVLMRTAGSCWLFALLLAATAGGRGLVGRLLATRPLVALGEASFAFYLVHLIVMRTLDFHFGPHVGMLATFALAQSLAFLLHRGVEIPMRRRVLALGEAGMAWRAPAPRAALSAAPES